MKRFLLILATLLLSHSSLMAQTKEFLQWYQNTRHRIERASEQDAEGAEVVQFPAELLRTLTPKEHQGDNNNLLGRIQVIYQMKIKLATSVQRSWYDGIKRWATYAPGLYEQRMALDGNTSIVVYESSKRRSKEPAEFLIFLENKDRGVVCDIVGYITLSDVITMLSPELKREHIKNPIEQLE